MSFLGMDNADRLSYVEATYSLQTCLRTSAKTTEDKIRHGDGRIASEREDYYEG